MVEVVALAVPLHDVRTLLVVDVFDSVSSVGRDALAVEPCGVGCADGIRGQAAEVEHGEGGGGDTGAVAEDAAACGRGEHGVAEAVDEVGCCGCFAKGGDEIYEC